MTSIALEELARGIAYGAHAGQVDKSGQLYITHPARIAARASGLETRVLSWLHDTVEDTGVTLELLRTAGFPESIVLQVDALTHRPGESREAYYRRILEWPAATVVKLLDVDDNSSEKRPAKLDHKTQVRLRLKYAKARQFLGGAA